MNSKPGVCGTNVSPAVILLRGANNLVETSLGPSVQAEGKRLSMRAHLEVSNPHPSEAQAQVRAVEPFVDAARAAKFLCCSRKHLLNLARNEQIPAHPFGGNARRTWLFKLSELDAAVRIGAGRLPISNELEAE